MEYWSVGFRGIKRTIFGRKLRFVSAFTSQYSSTPVLHHSMWMVQIDLTKGSAISISCRNPETFNYPRPIGSATLVKNLKGTSGSNSFTNSSDMETIFGILSLNSPVVESQLWCASPSAS